MAGFKVVSRVEIIVDKVSSNALAAMQEVGQIGVEGVQYQMLYGYHTPHGEDGHTEIVDTGRTFDSITTETEQVSPTRVETVVGTNVPYAIYVHDGTYKLEARPFVRDGIMSNETLGKIKSVITEQIFKGI